MRAALFDVAVSNQVGHALHILIMQAKRPSVCTNKTLYPHVDSLARLPKLAIVRSRSI